MIEKSIMKTGEWERSVMYRVACDCKDKDCDTTLEIEKEQDLDMVFLNLYKDLVWSSYWHDDCKWYKNIWLRIKCAIRVLVYGKIKVQETFVMREEQINAFIKALNEAKEYLKKS